MVSRVLATSPVNGTLADLAPVSDTLHLEAPTEASVILPPEQATHVEFGGVAPLGTVLSLAVRWQEDGEYVVQSTEFDVMGVGTSYAQAARDFFRKSSAFAVYLADVVESGVATDHEREVAAVLGARWASGKGGTQSVGQAKARQLAQRSL